MNQSAKIIYHAYSPRQPLRIECYRDGEHMMTIRSTSRRDAEQIAAIWRSGANQARMAELLRGLGIK